MVFRVAQPARPARRPCATIRQACGCGPRARVVPSATLFPLPGRGPSRRQAPHQHTNPRAHARPAPSPSTASRITFGRPPRSSQPARPPGPAPICGSLWPPRLDQGRGSFSQPGAWDREAASGSTGGHEAPILSTGSKKVGVARSFRRGRARNNRDSDTFYFNGLEPPAREFSWVRDLIENPVGMADKVVEKGLSGQVGGEARVSAPIVTFC